MEDLFIKWQKARPEYNNFNEDDIINKEYWENMASSKKILFILKETNGLEGSLTSFLKNGGSSTYYTFKLKKLLQQIMVSYPPNILPELSLTYPNF